MLVVDDDEMVLAGCVRRFGREWYVMTASDADTARELARSASPSVAIVDLRLGSESGLEIIRQLKREHPHIKVAMISGYVTIDAAVAATLSGADAVLAKPVRPAEILRRLEQGPREPDLDETISLARVEYEHIARVLADCNGNISEASRRLGIHRHSLQRKLKKAAPKS
jgi:two-component system response regulator RegA